MTVPETAIQNRHNNIILTCISLIPFIDYTLSYLILHIGVQYLPDIVRLPSAVRDKETIQISIVYYVPCPVDGTFSVITRFSFSSMEAFIRFIPETATDAYSL
mgnify:CR=1 FL=1